MPNCLSCSKDFPRRSNKGASPKWCSKLCYQKEFFRNKRGTVIPAPRPCAYCGKEFTPGIRHNWAKHCSLLCGLKRNDATARGRARKAVTDAVRMGKLEKPTQCSACLRVLPKQKLDGHHHNGYSAEHRLDVIWLCRKCHAKAPMDIN